MKYAMTEDELAEVLESMPNKRGNQIMRYKGLGEMDADELAETAMDPLTRRLIRVEVADVVKADEIFNTLMGDQVSPRRDFILKYAQLVENLDV